MGGKCPFVFRSSFNLLTPDIIPGILSPLYIKMAEDMKKWKVSLSYWFGRICAAKVNILSRLLYLFRTLPIGISGQDLKRFHGKNLKFIWGDQRPRVNKRILNTPKRMGGLGVPNLLKYFQAAQVVYPIKFHSNHYPLAWMQIEASLCSPT